MNGSPTFRLIHVQAGMQMSCKLACVLLAGLFSSDAVQAREDDSAYPINAAAFSIGAAIVTPTIIPFGHSQVTFIFPFIKAF